MTPEDPDVEAHGSLGFVEQLDSPRVGIAAFAVFVVVLLLIVGKVWADERSQVQRIDAIITERRGEAKAANRESVRRCFSAANQGPAIIGVLKALEESAPNETVRAKYRSFRQLSEVNTPTLMECRQLANRLNVTVSPEVVK